MSPRERRASVFAATAHHTVGQRRKYTGEPYINHPAAVVALVRSVPHTEAMLCAAWLHDTVEDTNTTIDDILFEFGFDVFELVEMLTDVSSPEDGNRAARKAIDRTRLAKTSTEAQTIKLADLVDNARSIIIHDPKFAVTFFAEMNLLLEVLKSGNAYLWLMAAKIVDDYYANQRYFADARKAHVA